MSSLDSNSSHFAIAGETPSAQKEQAIRTWIARKECVCPYAPGLARFTTLPVIDDLSMDHVYWFARELKAFYGDKENGKRVGRWMLLPPKEWQSHEEAHVYSERVFWLLNAAYYHLLRDRKSVQASLKQSLKGYNRGYKGEILNPIVGKLPNPNADVVPAKSLFYSALSPLYKSKKFYRYAPHSVIPLVYASEFNMLKKKHTQVSEDVAFEMACGGLYELFGDDLPLDLTAFRKELPAWGTVIDRTAEILRASSKGTTALSPEARGCPASNLSYFRLSQEQLIGIVCSNHSPQLPLLKQILQQTQASPKQVIAACFPGSGLYTIP